MNDNLILHITQNIEIFKGLVREGYDTASSLYKRSYDGTISGKPIRSVATEEDIDNLLAVVDFFEGFRSLLD